jgi:hypothetical protein
MTKHLTKTFDVFLEKSQNEAENSFSVHTRVLLYNHSKGRNKKVPPKPFFGCCLAKLIKRRNLWVLPNTKSLS